MDWVLIVVLTYMGGADAAQPPVIQIPVASETACLAAAETVKTELSIKRYAESLDYNSRRADGVMTSCVEASPGWW